jgi:hypothetical protein
MLPDAGTTAGKSAAIDSKTTPGTIGEMIESVWKGTNTAVKAAVAAAVAAALVLLLGNAFLAAKRRRVLGKCPSEASVYTDTAARTHRTDSRWARSMSSKASETQPLLHAAYGSI